MSIGKNYQSRSTECFERVSASPKRKPEPVPRDLRYYPKTYSAAENLKKVLETSPPDTDDLVLANDVWKRKLSQATHGLF